MTRMSIPSSSPSSSSSSLPLLILLLLTMALLAETRPSPPHVDSQVFSDLFGPRIGALVLESEVTEGSALPPPQTPPPPQPERRGGTGPVVLPGGGRVWSRLFQDFLSHQRAFRGRTRKSGRGCFGMKMDRIGALSGLGC
ncbi:C-type natriuretic peptide 2 [Amia ocellicauda]|uniref:C-type natriuretic peptide 2 n=1 Tax=Amia ocellicauda TaxID=2972642 RepID=UPI00346434DA